MTPQEQFDVWLSQPESRHLEFKAASNDFDTGKLFEYCVALANEGGGKIILGVTDRRPRTVNGTRAFPEPGQIEGRLFRTLRHRIPVEELFHQGNREHRVLIFHIPGRLPATPWAFEGKFLRRAGEELIPIPADELRLIFAEAAPDFSAEQTAATMSDLLPTAIADFRTRWARKSPALRAELWNDEDTLINAELLIDRQMTNAALLLFGTRAALSRYLPQAEFIFEYRSGEEAGPAQERVEFREGFLSFNERLWELINLRNDRQSYQDGFFRYDIPTFSETSVREAVLNAFAHREDRLNGSDFVRQYSKRLEVISPGGFPVGITPENILEQQNPRNRRLAEALSRCGLIERSGQGMNLMVESAIRESKPLPDFSGSDAHEVRLTLRGTVQDTAFLRFLEKVGEEKLRSFSTHDFLALDALRREQPLSDVPKTRLPSLIEAGIVESFGRGKGVRYILSRSLYAEMGAKGVYTRRKGLDHETNKALVEKHLRDSHPKGAPMKEFLQVLPSFNRSQVNRLLEELHSEGKAYMTGKNKGARWHAGTSPSPEGFDSNQGENASKADAS
jgi:ATP-dependent DNA helicase RecG